MGVFAPSLATDLAAALTLPSPPHPARATGLSPGAAAGVTAGALGGAASAPVPAGVILGGLGGGGIRIPPPPPRPFPQPEGLSAVGVPVVSAPAGGVGTTLRRILRGDSEVSPSLDDSKRYRLESPRKGMWQGGTRRGSGASTDGGSGGKSREFTAILRSRSLGGVRALVLEVCSECGPAGSKP